jgi:hypothetical protein
MLARGPGTRRTLAGLALGVGIIASLTPTSAVRAQSSAAPALQWERTLGGAVRESSPGIGDVDGDGQLDLVVGSHDGAVNVLRGGDGTPTPDWPQPTSHAISSSPTVADTTGDGRPEIHIGSGTDASGSGALYSFAPDGAVRWRYSAADRVFPSPAIHATAAIGDIDGDGASTPPSAPSASRACTRWPRTASASPASRSTGTTPSSPPPPSWTSAVTASTTS